MKQTGRPERILLRCHLLALGFASLLFGALQKARPCPAEDQWKISSCWWIDCALLQLLGFLGNGYLSPLNCYLASPHSVLAGTSHHCHPGKPRAACRGAAACPTLLQRPRDAHGDLGQVDSDATYPDSLPSGVTWSPMPGDSCAGSALGSALLPAKCPGGL